jgi:hypothetical protein
VEGFLLFPSDVGVEGSVHPRVQFSPALRRRKSRHDQRPLLQLPPPRVVVLPMLSSEVSAAPGPDDCRTRCSVRASSRFRNRDSDGFEAFFSALLLKTTAHRHGASPWKAPVLSSLRQRVDNKIRTTKQNTVLPSENKADFRC